MAASTTEFRWPVRGRVVQGFGRQPSGSHSDGIAIAVPSGTQVKAAENGVVVYAGNELRGYGNLVLVRHDNDFVTAYAHNSELLVRRGETVRRGQAIARSGQSGSAQQPQLHFEIRRGSTPVDPQRHLTGS
jgi:murein DD-endopeptidase MepM/ murein hydrolase activator NlpD